MGWVRKQATPHRCPLPGGADRPRRSSGQPGDVWRCDDCGLLWHTVVESTLMLGLPVAVWAPAPWWIRLRHLARGGRHG